MRSFNISGGGNRWNSMTKPKQWTRAQWSRVVNFLAFNALWPLCVIGAARGNIWPGVALSLFLLLWHWVPAHRVKGDFVLVALALVVGAFLDTLWIRLGYFQLATPGPYPLWAPVWIMALWLGFALALNHSLQWLQRWPLWSGMSFLFFAPFSYFMASRLGAVIWLADFWLIASSIGVSWCVLMTVLLWLAKRMRLAHEQQASQESLH